MQDRPTPVTDALAEFAVGVSPARLPAAVKAAAGRCLLDWLGVSIRGAREPLAAALHAVADATGGDGQATIVGRGGRTSALLAAMANGAQAHALDFDDTHIPSLVHGSAPVAPVVLAVGEWQHRSGADALAAFVAGFEVETRIGGAIGHALAGRGWHATAVLGHFGAAAAAGRLLGLDAARMRAAFGIAGTQAAGLEVAFGSMCKPLHAGKAAMNGLLAALLASKGFTGPASILEGDGSLPATFLGAGRLDPVLDDLGQRYAVLENSIKPYAACLLTHATIDAGREIRERCRPRPEEIDSVVCRVHPLALKVAAQPAPRTGLEGKFSLAFCAALALLRGRAGEAEFTDAAARDPELRRVAGRVRLEAVQAHGEAEARMTVRMADGRTIEAHVPAARGTAANPLSGDELEAKFGRLVEGILPPERARRLLGAIADLEAAQDLAAVVPLAAPAPAAPAATASGR